MSKGPQTIGSVARAGVAVFVAAHPKRAGKIMVAANKIIRLKRGISIHRAIAEEKILLTTSIPITYPESMQGYNFIETNPTSVRVGGRGEGAPTC